MTAKTKRKTSRKRWSYSAGECKKNRIRAYERGSKGIYLDYSESIDGKLKRVRISLQTKDREVAKAEVDRLAAMFREAGKVAPTELTLQMLFDMYEREVSKTKGEGKQQHDARCKEMFCRFFGAHHLAEDLSILDWNRFILARRQGTIAPLGVKKPRTVRNRIIEYDLHYLSAALRFATLAPNGNGKRWLDHNPVQGFPFPKEESPQRPIVDADDYDALKIVAASIHPDFELALALANDTGHRSASLRHLRWSDIDFPNEKVRWRAEHDKIKFEHTTRLDGEALCLLKARQKADQVIGDAWVFPSPRKPTEPRSRQTFMKWFRKAVEKAKLEPMQRRGFHSLRRKFASELKSASSKCDVAYLGGWKSTRVLVDVYQTPDEETQREILENRRRLRRSASKMSDSGT